MKRWYAPLFFFILKQSTSIAKAYWNVTPARKRLHIGNANSDHSNGQSANRKPLWSISSYSEADTIRLPLNTWLQRPQPAARGNSKHLYINVYINISSISQRTNRTWLNALRTNTSYPISLWNLLSTAVSLRGYRRVGTRLFLLSICTRRRVALCVLPGIPCIHRINCKPWNRDWSNKKLYSMPEILCIRMTSTCVNWSAIFPAMRRKRAKRIVRFLK